MDLWEQIPDDESPMTATGAQSKRPDPAPSVRQPMQAGIKPADRRRPTTDQRKARRQMNKSAGRPAYHVTPQSDGMVGVGAYCTNCGYGFSDSVDATALKAFESGTPVQDAFKYTSPAMREGLFITGICPDCQSEMTSLGSTTASTTKTSTRRKATETMNDAQPTEVELTHRMAKATTLAEQSEIARQIEALRAAKRESIAAQASLDWDMDATPMTREATAAASVLAETAPGLTASASMGVDSSDWLMNIETPSLNEQGVHHAAKAAASQWYAGAPDALKADPQEFTAQAVSAAARTGAPYGLQSTAAAQAFTQQVQHLASRDRVAVVTTSKISGLTCWCGAPATDITAVDPAISSSDVTMSDGMPGKAVCADHVTDLGSEKIATRKTAATFEVGDRIERDGKTYEVTRVTPAGAAGSAFSNGPTYHAKPVVDGTVLPAGQGVTLDIWSGSMSNPTSAFSKTSAAMSICTECTTYGAMVCAETVDTCHVCRQRKDVYGKYNYDANDNRGSGIDVKCLDCLSSGSHLDGAHKWFATEWPKMRRGGSAKVAQTIWEGWEADEARRQADAALDRAIRVAWNSNVDPGVEKAQEMLAHLNSIATGPINPYKSLDPSHETDRKVINHRVNLARRVMGLSTTAAHPHKRGAWAQVPHPNPLTPGETIGACPRCGSINSIVQGAPGTSSTGYQTRTCKDCGYSDYTDFGPRSASLTPALSAIRMLAEGGDLDKMRPAPDGTDPAASFEATPEVGEGTDETFDVPAFTEEGHTGARRTAYTDSEMETGMYEWGYEKGEDARAGRNNMATEPWKNGDGSPLDWKSADGAFARGFRDGLNGKAKQASRRVADIVEPTNFCVLCGCNPGDVQSFAPCRGTGGGHQYGYTAANSARTANLVNGVVPAGTKVTTNPDEPVGFNLYISTGVGATPESGWDGWKPGEATVFYRADNGRVTKAITHKELFDMAPGSSGFTVVASGGVAEPEWLVGARKVLEHKQYDITPSVPMDYVTAGMLVQVWDALGDANKAKMAAMGLLKAVDFGWRVIDRAKAKAGAIAPAKVAVIANAMASKIANGGCQAAGTNHSDDLIEVYLGRPEPVLLCGYHNQQRQMGLNVMGSLTPALAKIRLLAAEGDDESGEGKVCSDCGDKVAQDEDGSYHHDNGEKHDHAAKVAKVASLAYACTKCGMEADTDDLTVIGRNCSATDFEQAHDMQPTSTTARRTAAQTCPSCGQDTLSDTPVIDMTTGQPTGETGPSCSNCDYGVDNVEKYSSRREAGRRPFGLSGKRASRKEAGPHTETCPKCKAKMTDIMTNHENTVLTAKCGECEWSGTKRKKSAGLGSTAQRTAMPNPVDLGIKVGDFFYSSWGYDQTNIDFFEVVGLTGASVKVVQVRSKVVGGDNYTEQVVPVPGSGAGQQPVTRRVQSYGSTPSFTVNSFSSASLWDGKPKYRTGPYGGH